MTRRRILCKIFMLIVIAAVCVISVGMGAAGDVNVMLEGHFGGIVNEVAVSGNYAYINQGQDFVVFDISNPTASVEVGRIVTRNRMSDIEIAGDYAYLTTEFDGLVVVDISNPMAPTLAGNYDTAGYAYAVEVAGNYAYVADWHNGLVIMDISNPTAPTLAGSYDTAGFAYGVTVTGNYAYVADYSNGLVVVDISNPMTPTLAGSYDTAGYAYGVEVAGNYAYVADWHNGLVIMDISNPTAPVLAATYNTAGYAWGVAVAGSYAYVANRYNGLVIVDISTPTAPVLAATYGTAGNARGVAVAGSYAYIADASNGLVVVDISTPTAPALAANDTAGSAVGVAVAGSYAYVADWSNGLVVVDISTPTAPAVAGTYDTPGSAYGVAVAGSYAYVADGSNGLVVVDISNPTTPALAATYNTAGSAIGVAVSGSYAYVADWSNGLVIIDISNPTTPALAATYNTAGSARGIAVSESYAYVANDANGLVIVDISTPTAPALAGTHNTAGSAYDVAVAGSYAYVADRYNGLVIVDISTPTAPALSGTYDTAGEPFDVAVSGSYAYVVDNDNGLVILRTDVSSTTGSVHNINKGTNYTTIQAAIDDASPGDEIHVDSGTYYENVDVNKQLTLRGIDTGSGIPVVNSGDTEFSIGILIDANDVTIEGFEIVNSDFAGIFGHGDNIQIVNNNIISNHYWGIILHSNNSILDQNNITNPIWDGTEANETGGIWVAEGSFYNITNNNILNGLWGISEGSLSFGFGGIEPILGGNLHILNNKIINTNIGIFLGSDHNIVKYNYISTAYSIYYELTGTGIVLYTSNSTIKENYIENNERQGILLIDSDNNTFFDNEIIDNGIGINLTGSSNNNRLFHNNFNNTVNAVDEGPQLVNEWDDSYPSGGNYWSDYYGDDLKSGPNQDQPGSDGIGDTPYPIPGDSSVDNYPLMAPWDSAPTAGPVHNINKGTDYTSIQAAIDDASPGDEIHVDAGTYIENVDVNKQLTLIGKGMDEVTVVAADTSDHAFEVTADYVNISGFMVTGTTGFYKAGFYLDNSFDSIISHNNASNNNCGIYFSNSSNTTLQNNIVLNNEFGIELWQSNNVILQNNRASNNNYGINLWNLDNNTLLSNTASDNRFGIGFSHSSNNTLQNNIISGNTYNFRIFGDSLADYTQQIDKTNMVDGKPIYYWMDQQDKQIPEDAGFIGVVNSTNILVKDLNLVNSGQGILFAYTKNSRIENVDVSNSWNCIDMHSSDNNTLHSNTASNNQFNIVLWYSNNNTLASNNASNNRFGFQLRDSNNNMLVSNNALNNWYGIYLNSSNDNTLYHNNLIDNIGNNAYDDSHNNAWDNGYPSGGNYLSDYTGVDLKKGLNQDQPGSDGIGDTPHPIPGGSSVDRYPLMAPYSTPPSDYEGKLLRQIGDFKIYLIEDDKKRHFTSPEALEWDGYSFDDIIEVSEDVINSFELGSDITITQAIIDKYNALGGAATFGPPAGTGEQPGYPDSSGVVCTYVNFQNGAIEYFTNGDQAGNAYAILNPFFDKWASMGYAKSVLGYPISDMSDTQTSSFGTLFKYQNFINGTESGALEHNLATGEVFEIHGAIYATWSAMGYADSILGLVTSDERDAVPSFKGTTGRVSDFENGHLHWHSSGDHYMVTYMTYDDLDELYVSMGGTASWLGFPVMHQEDRGGYGYCEFEGGYIEWDGSEYKAKAAIEIIKPGVVFEGTFDQFNYGTYPMIMEITSVDGLEFNGILHWPTLGDSKTKFRGNIDSVTNKIWFTEYEQIQGSSNIVLNGDYYADLEGQTLSGYWNWPNGVKGGTFSITMSETEAPTITVTSPNGGEDWQVGTTQTIQWSYTGDTGPGVEIEIFNSSGPVQTFTYVPIGSDGSGSYLWTISGNLADGTDYQVRITIIGSAYSDTSDRMFTISTSTAPQDKSLIQVEGQSKVYWFQNNKLYWVTDWNVINQMLNIPGWDSVKSLPVSEFNPADYEQGPRFITTDTISDGLLICEHGHPEIYLISGSEKHHFTSPEALEWNGYSFDDVIDVSSAVIAMFPPGSDITITQAIIDKYNKPDVSTFLGAPEGKGEIEAGQSPHGTTGTYVEFANGHIHWISNNPYENIDNPNRGKAFFTYGDLDWKYTFLGGTNDWLGFPVMDEEKRDEYGHGYCEFEGGYIDWDANRGEHFVVYYDPYNQPDLIVTDISFSKDDPAEGEPITVTAKIKNIGPVDIQGDMWIYFWQVSYYNDFENDEKGSEAIIQRLRGPGLASGQEVETEITWNVASIYTTQDGIVKVEVDADEEIDEIDENNNNRFGKVTVTSLADFRPERDAYHFKNFEPSTDQKIDMTKNVKAWFDLSTNPFGLGIDIVSLLGGSLCYGMSSTDILYYDERLPKPVDKNVFDMLKTDKDVTSNILRYQAMQFPDLLFNLFIGLQPDYLVNVENQFNKIEDSIKNGEYVVSHIRFYDENGDTKGSHAVLPIGTYSKDKIKNVIVIDPNHPGMSRVIQFDFENNKIIYKDLYKGLYEVHASYLSTTEPLLSISDGKKVLDVLSDMIYKSLFDIKSKLLMFKCPIDITIIDQYGRIIDNKGNNEIPGSKVQIIGDSKIFLLPADLDYSIRIDAYDSGDFTFTQINPLTSEYASLISFVEVPITENSIAISEVSSINPEYMIKIDYDGDGTIDEIIMPDIIDIVGANFYNITFLPPITTMDQFNLTDGSTLPIKFTARNSTTDEFIYDDTVNVTITNSTGHLITYFTYGTGTDSVRINTIEEQYIVNFHSRNYALNVGETYAITVTFGEPDSLRGYEITYFTLVDKGKGKEK